MSDDKAEDLLDELFDSEYAPPRPKGRAEAALKRALDAPLESVLRVRRLYAEKVFRETHPEPVKTAGRDETFGVWLRAAREKAELSPNEVGVAVGRDAQYIERVESGGVQPWDLEAPALADLVFLTRLHIDGASRLIRNSYEAELQAWQDQQIAALTPIDGSKGRNARTVSRDDEVCIQGLRQELVRRQAVELLS